MLQPKKVACLLASLFLVLVTMPVWGASKADDEETIRNASHCLAGHAFHERRSAQCAGEG